MVANAGRTELATERSGRGSAITLALVLALLLVAAPSPARAAEWTVTSTADTVDGNLGDGACATASGACTLRAAIQEANMRMGADAITVPGGVYTIRGIGAEPGTPGGGLGFDPALFVDWEGDHDIAGPLTITGAGMGATIVDGGTPPFGAPPDQTAIDRLFEIHPTAGDVTISGLTAREGWSADEGGAIVNRSTGVVRLVDVAVRDSVSTAYGGGIHNAGPLDGICPLTCPLGNGRLELTRVEVTGNSTGGEGGGVFSTESTLRVSGRTDARSLFRANTAAEGAAIFHGGEATPTGARARLEIGHARSPRTSHRRPAARSTTGTRATSSSPTASLPAISPGTPAARSRPAARRARRSRARPSTATGRAARAARSPPTASGPPPSRRAPSPATTPAST